jgi:hypothetical protein
MVSVGPMLNQDSQHFHTRGPLCQRGIEAVATLFNGGHVKSRGVGNGLDVCIGSQIVIRSGNCRELPFAEIRDSLGKFEIRVKVGIPIVNAIASPPTGVSA